MVLLKWLPIRPNFFFEYPFGLKYATKKAHEPSIIILINNNASLESLKVVMQ
jgi:hypothetical protein